VVLSLARCKRPGDNLLWVVFPYVHIIGIGMRNHFWQEKVAAKGVNS